MKNNKTDLNFKNKRGEDISMSEDEVARWCCLVEAVDIIDKKGSQMGVDLAKNNWVKPIAIQKYIDERFDTMIEEIEHEKQNHPVTIG
jgi:hypothetical protein